MKKIKVSADTVLAILKGIMDDEDINYTITDQSAPKEWQDRKIQEVLNVKYYTFQHKPYDTERLVVKLMEQGEDADSLYALQRAFCILSLNSTERVYSKENDIVTVSASLEYWIQTEKVKFLEDLLEDVTIESTGVRIPVRVGSEDRQVLLVIGKITSSEIEETTEFGEMSVCNLDIDMIFYPPATTIADYKVEFEVQDGNEKRWVVLPFSSISVSNSMTQKAVPLIANAGDIGNINLSKVKTIALGFDGYKNEFIDKLSKNSLISEESGQSTDNNEMILLKLSRGEYEFLIQCIVKEHTITVSEDSGTESHSLILVKRGL